MCKKSSKMTNEEIVTALFIGTMEIEEKNGIKHMQTDKYKF